MSVQRCLFSSVIIAVALLVSGCMSANSGSEAIHHGGYVGIHGGHGRASPRCIPARRRREQS